MTLKLKITKIKYIGPLMFVTPASIQEIKSIIMIFFLKAQK